MRGMFYQAKFCVECGNRLEARRWWQARYFCADCATRLRKRDWSRLLFAPLIVALLMLIFFNARERNASSDQNPVALPARSAVVSAQDATTSLKPALPLPTQPHEVFFCGARTKKGKPCKIRVQQQGLRCYWHVGRASLRKQ